MKIDFRATGLPARQLQDISATVLAAFREVAHGVARVLVCVSAQADKRQATRNCVIEVHLADGRVEYVEERQRRLGSALRRAVQRAWRAAARWLDPQAPRRELPLLAQPRLVALPIPLGGGAQREQQR